ncbi:hypothetical protein ElyMa_002543500 [Elysia marginata]|uniref:Uncharacterized protein n=1 Tax=Elysia marginata TaxID=1093978 RepID=A0AAV4GW25_9GAST|nr:hypothetical protein ElyMa_002543500 [Elysia marginata]
MPAVRRGSTTSSSTSDSLESTVVCIPGVCGGSWVFPSSSHRYENADDDQDDNNKNYAFYIRKVVSAVFRSGHRCIVSTHISSSMGRCLCQQSTNSLVCRIRGAEEMTCQKKSKTRFFFSYAAAVRCFLSADVGKLWFGG